MAPLRYSVTEMKTLPRIDLKTPLSEKEIRRLSIGDIVFLSGTIATARDQAHLRAIKETRRGKPIPVDFKQVALYHCGPIVRRVGDAWSVIAAGPTTSYRMENVEAEFIELFGVRMIIGKGGMGQKTAKALRKFGAVYCDFTGGAALLAAKAIVVVEDVAWLDLGVPEAIWRFSVKDFGPLLITMDSAGNNYRDKIGAQDIEI